MKSQTIPNANEYSNLEAYRKYIEDSLDKIERGGWTPVCFDEFASSEECSNYKASIMDANDWFCSSGEIADTILDFPVGTRVRISGSFGSHGSKHTLERAVGTITHARGDFCIKMDGYLEELISSENHAVWTEMELFGGALTYCEVLHVPDETDESIDADIDDCRMNTTVDGRYIAANKEQPETHLVSLTFEQAEYIADCMKERPDCKVAQGIFGEVLEVIV